MALEALIRPFPWALYSKKLASRIEMPRWQGWFNPLDVRPGMRRVEGRAGSIEAGNAVILYWFVDELDGIIADAVFSAFGQSALIGAADGACELCRGKSYAQASRIGADLIDRHLRDRSTDEAFPVETSAHLNLVITAIEEAAQACVDIPLAEPFTPAPVDFGEVRPDGYPGFDQMSNEQQLALIEQVVAEEIRPFIELDAGGIELRELCGRQLTIAYQGSCTSCHSATGMTLSYIQELLRAKVHPQLTVIPDLSSLQQDQFT